MTRIAQQTTSVASERISPFAPVLPAPRSHECLTWGHLYGSSAGLAIAAAAQRYPGPLVVITTDMHTTESLERELQFYSANSGHQSVPILTFPDRETLPYDVFSPHQDITSQRLGTLQRISQLDKGILLVPSSTLMHRLPPRAYIDANSLVLKLGEQLDLDRMRRRLETSGYRFVSQVMEHGEFSVRGSLIDLYPMGSSLPYRIDLFDDEVDSIRTFDPENQLSIENVTAINLLPAREFPLTDESIARFRQAWRTMFEGDPQKSILYRDVSHGIATAGIEYYLPLFFDHTDTLFDYLPTSSLIMVTEGMEQAADAFWDEIEGRHEQGRHDNERPLVAPTNVFCTPAAITAAIDHYPHVYLQHFEVTDARTGYNFTARAVPTLARPVQASSQIAGLLAFISGYEGRILIVAETTGRREALLEMLRTGDRYPTQFADWPSFLGSDSPLGIAVASLDNGLLLDDPSIAIITESQVFGEQVMQRRRRRTRERDTDAIIRNLTELEPGAPVVHEEHGVGRYLGLQTLTVGGVKTEFLTLAYADNDKLYVPVSSLYLISRYAGASPEQAPLHKLGSDQWQRAKRRAAGRVCDVAAELLDIYARREARKGHAYHTPDDQYATFASAFPFEETPDQQDAIHDVIGDMVSDKPMDRLVCGDVGFGKTEVAMRATFIAIEDHAQVAVLVPTTLLAQQHYQNFSDRFADLPVRIEVLSRFRSKKQQQAALDDIEAGRIDIVIGTHKLLQEGIKFKNLGLVIIDEEHRFGARQKERLKALRTEVDVLTLTATPIPRTLNMALAGLRDLSIIATPPMRRLAIKTFIREWNAPLLREAILREIKRGGQVYLLHNEVRTIDKIAHQVSELVPEAEIHIAHGQMRERELEQIMLDFYHQRFNVLVCSTIIESGIDVPNANTIIINRADRFGLAQLHQLRGRVGRSHHQAYAFLIIPPRGAMSADAVKRLEAIESLEDLGAGFTLATHDLEIRGAGEFLGEEQSGHIQEIGFTLYTELLERAIQALKSGKQPELDRPLALGSEIDLGIPALIPDDYLPDVHARLVMYKRIASAADQQALDELQVEMIDRFGLLPDATKNLTAVTELKLKAAPLGIRKIEAGATGGRLIFGPDPDVNPDRIIELIQNQPDVYKFDGKDRLRFNIPMLDGEERIRIVNELLDTIE